MVAARVTRAFCFSSESPTQGRAAAAATCSAALLSLQCRRTEGASLFAERKFGDAPFDLGRVTGAHISRRRVAPATGRTTPPPKALSTPSCSGERLLLYFFLIIYFGHTKQGVAVSAAYTLLLLRRRHARHISSRPSAACPRSVLYDGARVPRTAPVGAR